MTEEKTEVVLEKPGAGLPFHESILANLVLRIGAWRSNQEQLSDRFLGEAHRIEKLLHSRSERDCRKQTLISRFAGIEDSSRNWSAYMVAHHLIIVDSGIIGIIERLVLDEPIDLTVRIAEVKPDPSTGPDVVSAFLRSSQDYLERLKKLPDLRSRRGHLHPWFGKLNALQWHTLAAMHHTIHRRQIEKILQKENSAS